MEEDKLCQAMYTFKYRSICVYFLPPCRCYAAVA